MDEELTNPSGQTTNAVSLFSQGGSSNDFPVLKAFQEYIDAEQTKARKRMLGLSIFFVVLLMVVVATFAVILVMLVNSKQAMMDRLLDMAMQEKKAAAVVMATPGADASAASAEVSKLNDKIAALQEKLVLQQLERERAEQTAREEKLRAEQARQAREQAAREEKMRQEQAALKKSLEDQRKAMDKALAEQRAELESARKTLEASRKSSDEANSKEAERERFLRRQYPDYYAKVDAAKKRAESQPAALPQKQPAKVKPVSKQTSPKRESIKGKADEAAKAATLDDIKPIDYFSQSVESVDVDNGDDDFSLLIKKPNAAEK